MKHVASMVVALAAAGCLVDVAWAQPAAQTRPGPAATSPAVLLEKGIYAEETVGDLDAAMKVYRQIVDDAAANRPYIAQATYRLGMCSLKKGQKDQAAELFRRVVSSFADQKAVAALATAELDKLAGVVKRKVNKKVADFPVALDLSTPERAAASWQRACAAKDSNAISELSLVRIDPDQDRQWWASQAKRDPEGLAVYVKALAESEIVEVLVYKDDLADVITLLPFPEGKGRDPYSLRSFGRVSGQWKNLGEDRLPSLEAAEGTFSRKKDALWASFQSILDQREGRADATPSDKAPIVLRTSPPAFANDVDASLAKITVTFDRPMMDKSWSFTAGDKAFGQQTGTVFPDRAGDISYDAARTTCSMPVKLQPGKVYWVGVNSPSFQDFKSADGTPAMRYQILFATESADGKPTPLPDGLVKQAKEINESAAAAGKAMQLKAWVEDFFQHNYRDITSRQTIEWGQPQQDAAGNLSIRYKYLATIWDKDKLTIEDVFTFTPEGKFVSVKKLSKSAVTQPSDADKRAAEDLASDGWKLWGERKLPEAEAKFQAAVAKDPGNSNAWNGLGWAQLNQGKRANAKASFEKAVVLEPKHAAALNGLGWIAKGEGKTDEAIGYWKKAVEAVPTATAAISGLASTYMELKQYNKAVEYYEILAKAEPNNPEVKTALEAARKAAANTPATRSGAASTQPAAMELRK